MPTPITGRPGISHQRGYVLRWSPEHPNNVNGYVREHILIAEKALGRLLPDGVKVHHHDMNPANNQNSNLVICENDAYHSELHRRMRVFNAGGDPNTDRMCCYCKKPKPSSDFGSDKGRINGRAFICKPCNRKRTRKSDRRF